MSSLWAWEVSPSVSGSQFTHPSTKRIVQDIHWWRCSTIQGTGLDCILQGGRWVQQVMSPQEVWGPQPSNALAAWLVHSRQFANYTLDPWWSYLPLSYHCSHPLSLSASCFLYPMKTSPNPDYFTSLSLVHGPVDGNWLGLWHASVVWQSVSALLSDHTEMTSHYLSRQWIWLSETERVFALPNMN